MQAGIAIALDVDATEHDEAVTSLLVEAELMSPTGRWETVVDGNRQPHLAFDVEQMKVIEAYVVKVLVDLVVPASVNDQEGATNCVDESRCMRMSRAWCHTSSVSLNFGDSDAYGAVCLCRLFVV